MQRASDPSNSQNRDDTARKPDRRSARGDRLKAALKANMARRKAQAKARGAEDAPDETKGKD
jgi:hypothetical protein